MHQPIERITASDSDTDHYATEIAAGRTEEAKHCSQAFQSACSLHRMERVHATFPIKNNDKKLRNRVTRRR